jgi:hypothetical protein
MGFGALLWAALTSAARAKKLADCGQVKVVVFRLKEDHVHQSHWDLKARVPGCTLEDLGLEPIETVNQTHPLFTKPAQNRFDSNLIVTGVISLAIGHVRRMQFGGSGEILIESLGDQRLEVEQVAGVFLNRPPLAFFTLQDFGRPASHAFLKPRWSAAHPLNHFRKDSSRKTEIKLPFCPFDSAHNEENSKQLTADSLIKESHCDVDMSLNVPCCGPLAGSPFAVSGLLFAVVCGHPTLGPPETTRAFEIANLRLPIANLSIGDR